MRRQLLLLYSRTGSTVQNAIIGQPGRRGYHDESFGFRKPREYVFPDCKRDFVQSFYTKSFVRPFLTVVADTQSQLENRASNAALMRYVDSMRIHGHRAARIDPLDLIHREEVAALSPARYGLVDEEKKYNVNGILWRRARDLGGEEDWLSLKDITEHLRKVYVGNIAYEVRFRPLYLLFKFLCIYYDNSISICTLLRRQNVYGFLTFLNPSVYFHQKTRLFWSLMRRRNGAYMSCWRQAKSWITFCN